MQPYFKIKLKESNSYNEMFFILNVLFFIIFCSYFPAFGRNVEWSDILMLELGKTMDGAALHS